MCSCSEPSHDKQRCCTSRFELCLHQIVECSRSSLWRRSAKQRPVRSRRMCMRLGLQPSRWRSHHRSRRVCTRFGHQPSFLTSFSKYDYLQAHGSCSSECLLHQMAWAAATQSQAKSQETASLQDVQFVGWTTSFCSQPRFLSSNTVPVVCISLLRRHAI